MSASPEGRQGAPFKMVVERGKIREFARATKSVQPRLSRRGPPTLAGDVPGASAFWQDASNSPWGGDGPRNFERILHGEQEFVFFGEPPRAGDVLTGVSRIDKVYEKAGRRGGDMKFTEMVTEFRDPTGKVVAESQDDGRSRRARRPTRRAHRERRQLGRARDRDRALAPSSTSRSPSPTSSAIRAPRAT